MQTMALWQTMENNNNTHNRFGSLGAASYGRGRGFILIVFTWCGRGRGGGRRRGVGGMGGACNRFIWFIYKRGGHCGHITNSLTYVVPICASQLKFPILTFFIKHLATGIIHVSSILRQLWPHKKVPLSYFFFSSRKQVEFTFFQSSYSTDTLLYV